MTNKEKILRYLNCGLKVKAVRNDNDKEFLIIHYMILDDNFVYIGSVYGFGKITAIGLEDCTLTPISHKPDFKVGDKVQILDIAREIDGFDKWCDAKKKMVGNVYTISGIDWEITLNNNYGLVYEFPTWALAPAFDEEDPKDKAIRELEEKMKELQSEIDKLKP